MGILDQSTHVLDYTDVTNSTTSAPENRCQYGSLTGGFSFLIQLLLALLAFSCLIVKRFCEPVAQRRSWIVWFYDTSKQGFGAALIHFANILISHNQTDSDPCIWYVMNFLLDSTVGLLFIYIALRILGCLARCCGCKDLRNGEYGDPPKCRRWIIQCVTYSLVLLAVKGVVIAVMTIPIWVSISQFIVSPIKSVKLELVLVMFVIPIVVNALIFWVVDNFLMKNLNLHSRSKKVKYSKLKDDIELEERNHLNESKHEL